MNKFCPKCPNYYKDVKFKNGTVDICYFHKDDYFSVPFNNRFPKNFTEEQILRIKSQDTFLPFCDIQHGLLKKFTFDLTNGKGVPDECLYKMELELIE